MPPTSLSYADVRRVAKLARLAISDAAALEHQKSLSAVMGYMDTLRSLDLSAVDVSAAALHPEAGGDGNGSHLAADEVGATLPNEALMSMAPQSMPPFVKVPKVLDEGGGA